MGAWQLASAQKSSFDDTVSFLRQRTDLVMRRKWFVRSLNDEQWTARAPVARRLLPERSA
jgi:hypothetical protein